MKIPVYDQQIVPTQGMGNTRIVAEQSGSGMAQIGEGLMNLAGALNDKQKRQDHAWFTENSSIADQKINEILNNEFKAMQPGAADFAKTVNEKVNKFAAEYESAAPAGAKELLKAHLARTKEATLKQSLNLENNESYRHMGQQFDTGLDISSKLVSSNPDLLYDNLGKFVLSAENMGTTAEQRANMKELARQKLASSAVMGSIDRNPSGNHEEAPGYNMLTSEEQAKVETYAKQKKNEFKAQKQASALISIAGDVMKAPPMLGSGVVDRSKAKAAAQKQASGLSLDPEQKLALDNYMERAAGDYERDYRRKVDASKANLFDQLEENGGDYQALVAKNPWIQNMEPVFRDDVNKFAGMVATGETRPTDWQVYSSLIDDPALLKSANLEAMKNSLSNKDYIDLVKMQKSLMNGEPEQDLLGNSTLIKQMLDEAGYKNNVEKQGQMFSLLQTAINQELSVTGKKKISQERIKELAADLMVKDITDRGFIWDTKQRGFLVDVPEDVRSRIEGSLIQSGMPVNDYNVLQAYRSILRKQNGQ